MDRHSRGLTLLELMVALAVLGMVLGMGVPAFRRASSAARADGVFHDLTASLAMARAIAVSRGVPVVTCPSRDGISCRQDGAWDLGWIAFQARSRQQRDAASLELVRMHDASSARKLVIQSTRPRVRFQPSGRSEGSNVSLCIYGGADGPLIGRIAVNRSGRIRSERTPNATICGNSP
ncbi:GspH/FimT family pseudopilin [Lysobacter sp. S4-A87]|uniref:GspH/FimT family pseudopilin n=1 Tax=Lysobacter sp. S4-A87 TaxID=2925843 RepID=UPI001F53875D|nr:GspH/FimT family pseudopilin [Lysobacter sp. S4-A87]UNK50592.1 GspH/FimT family pseudopilin [Lysobacter sp. S4-A87]